MNSEQKLRELFDREQIRDCLARYSQAIDRADKELLTTVYWPEAVDNHGVFAGPAAEFIDWVIPLQKTMRASQHSVSNILIRIDGSRARVQTYLQAFHTFTQGEGAPFDLLLGARYLDTMEKRGEEWRILDRTVSYDWYRKWSTPLDIRENIGNAAATFGGQAPDDAFYRLFGNAALTPL
jgi:SnoaL-like domain